MTGNSVEDKGVKALSETLKENTSLKTLFLECEKDREKREKKR